MPESPWILVAGDFRENGGMDRANAALAQHLVARGTAVHLVCHSASPNLTEHALVTMHCVRKPVGSYFLGSPLLDLKARSVFAALSRKWPQVRTVGNGGNCLRADVNWSHYVHSAWKPLSRKAPLWFRVRRGLEHRVECWRERQAYRNSRLIITNSNSTQHHVERCVGDTKRDVRTVYLGTALAAGPVTVSERALARQRRDIPDDRKIALFVGGLGFDGRKNFDLIVDAWERLGADSDWDVDLLVAGNGPALPYWTREIARRQLSARIRLLGFCEDVPDLLATSDVLIGVSRYEPYGLNIQEALSRGLSVVVSASAGIAERFPVELRPLLVPESADVEGLIERLRLWRADADSWRKHCALFGRTLSSRSWQEMAGEMVRIIEAMPTPAPQTDFLLTATPR